MTIYELWDEIAARMNFDEKKVVPRDLPEICGPDGSFDEKRRKEILALYEKYMYGKIPPPPDSFQVIVKEDLPGALNGKAVRRRLDLVCSMNSGDSITLPLLLYIPMNRKGKVPCFFGLNFKGNASTTEETIPLTPFPEYPGISKESLTLYDGTGEKQTSRWDFEHVIDRGFASATMWYGSVFPDVYAGFQASILRFFMTLEQWQSPERTTGAISAWSWGLMRVMDALCMQDEIDPARLIVHGHSRLGKTALWTGANDPRASIVISNCSGCCGAALLRRNFGENLELITIFQPHWFVPELKKYTLHDYDLPLDQNLLLSLIAPRPLAVASATDDQHADPRGEFLSLKAASKAYTLCGETGLPGTAEVPEPDTELYAGRCSYHIRTGKHDITPEDWQIYMDFATRNF